LLSWGLHRFCRSLYAGLRSPESDDSVNPAWPKRWTACILGLVLMMFIAGIALVGMTHQIAWLATSEEPLLESTGRSRSPYRIARDVQKNLSLTVVNRAYNLEERFPPGATLAPDGTLLYGWPVSLLPSLDEKAVYESINKEVPWNHPDNKEPMSRQLEVFYSPGYDDETRVTEEGYGTIRFAANSHLLYPGSRVRIRDITDGADNTLLFGEVNARFQAWGSPYNLRDPLLGLNRSPNGFGSPWQGTVTMSFASGRVESINEDIDPHVLHALATPRGGETISDDDF
ncbi:MAG: DUF1559 domain-containing protein, partial [Planctomycetaceae bacterium]|nr:DUF1559 domain-containing protein [Planctomycetaceae bacterium]